MAFFSSKTSNPVEELASIFREKEQPVEVAVKWAKEVIGDAGIESNREQLKAIKKLRDAEPALTLGVATYLFKMVRMSK